MNNNKKLQVQQWLNAISLNLNTINEHIQNKEYNIARNSLSEQYRLIYLLKNILSNNTILYGRKGV